MKHLSLYRCVLLVLAVALAAPLSAQPAPGGSAPSEALYEEAAEYARTQGVDLDVAVERLRLQRLIGELDARLRSEEHDRREVWASSAWSRAIRPRPEPPGRG